MISLERKLVIVFVGAALAPLVAHAEPQAHPPNRAPAPWQDFDAVGDGVDLSASSIEDGGGSDGSASGYVSKYEGLMFGNLSFFNRDPNGGDVLEQVDDLILSGQDASTTLESEFRGIELSTSFGLQTINQVLDTKLYSSRNRERLTGGLLGQSFQSSLIATASQTIVWTSWLSTEVGLRGDYIHADDRSESTTVHQTMLALNPTASVVAAVAADIEVFVNFGWARHFSSTRSAGEDSTNSAAGLMSYELGASTQLAEGLNVRTALFVNDMHGDVEAPGRTRRTGLRLDAQLELWSWLTADAGFSLGRGRLKDVIDDVTPLATRFAASTGLTVAHPNGLYGRVSLFQLGERPSSASAAAGFEYRELAATVGYRSDDLELTVSLQNISGDGTDGLSSNGAVECPDGTRAVGDSGLARCEDLNFSSASALNAQASLLVFF